MAERHNTQTVSYDQQTGEQLGQVHEHVLHFASCNLCEWTSPDREDESGAMGDLSDHLSDEHNYREPND